MRGRDRSKGTGKREQPELSIVGEVLGLEAGCTVKFHCHDTALLDAT
jgi:hypothetical protein